MTILYIANIRLPTEKAHGVQIMKMSEVFAELGHSVTLVVPRRHTPIRKDPFEYYSVRPSFTIIQLASLESIRFLGRIGFGLQTLSFAVASLWFTRRRRIDVLYTRDPAIAALAGFLGKIVLWEAHTASRTFLTAIAGRYATKVVVISQGLADFYARTIPIQKIIIAHDAVDLNEFVLTATRDEVRQALSLPKEKYIVEYMGKFRTMGHPKGVEEVIEAIGKLSRAYPEVFLLIVGLNEDELPLAQEVAVRAQLPPAHYRFVLHIPRSQVPRYLRAADVLLMNYPDTPHYAQMMSPLKVFEYMASGIPIVSSDLPSLREVLPEGSAHFVPPNDLEAFASGIERVLKDREYARSLGENARRTSEVYSWKKRAENILNSLRLS